jgi:hypothetical protein
LLHAQAAYTDRRGRRITREEVIRARRQDEIGGQPPSHHLPADVR